MACINFPANLREGVIYFCTLCLQMLCAAELSLGQRGNPVNVAGGSHARNVWYRLPARRGTGGHGRPRRRRPSVGPSIRKKHTLDAGELPREWPICFWLHPHKLRQFMHLGAGARQRNHYCCFRSHRFHCRHWRLRSYCPCLTTHRQLDKTLMHACRVSGRSAWSTSACEKIYTLFRRTTRWYPPYDSHRLPASFW